MCGICKRYCKCLYSCQRWFSKFRSGDLSLQESDRSGRPSKIDNDVSRFMLENNPYFTSQQIAEEFGILHITVGGDIKSLGFVLKWSVWVPHELTEKNSSDHMKSGFFTRMLREKNLTVNLEHHQQQFSKTKYPSTKSTALFEVGQERSSVYELLKQGKTINADLCYNQLDKLNAAIKEKMPELASRKGIVLLHDNARPHPAMVTKQKLNALGWEVLGHPPYSLDISPSDYYLFRYLQNYLMEKNSSLLKVFLRQLLTILTPRARTSAK
ncbi:histone-lysine N-methyltransferase SETMAR [Trichonephila clavipes]|nr:histone-lysine N-methyltransferase SETMAR [Trichonephila clavipes]